MLNLYSCVLFCDSFRATLSCMLTDVRRLSLHYGSSLISQRVNKPTHLTVQSDLKCWHYLPRERPASVAGVVNLTSRDDYSLITLYNIHGTSCKAILICTFLFVIWSVENKFRHFTFLFHSVTML